MSTIIVALIVVGSIAGICFLMVFVHNKHKREADNSLLNHFRQTGTENGLSFSSQELLKESVFGLDGISRKILVLTRVDDGYSSFTINLDEVTSCSVKKIYGTLRLVDRKDPAEKYLDRIVLQFDLHRKPPVEILFYKHITNHIYEWQELEQKAKHWEAVLSKMQNAKKLTA